MEGNLKNERNKNFAFVFLFLILIVLDQAVKSFARNIFLNNRFAFSVPIPTLLIYLIYFIVIATIIFYLSKNFQSLPNLIKMGWIFILAGACSNIVERIIFGAVRDFIYIRFYHWTGIYNLADFYIIFGIIVLLMKPNKIVH